jgi:hypothetical protein
MTRCSAKDSNRIGWCAQQHGFVDAPVGAPTRHVSVHLTSEVGTPLRRHRRLRWERLCKERGIVLLQFCCSTWVLRWAFEQAFLWQGLDRIFQCAKVLHDSGGVKAVGCRGQASTVSVSLLRPRVYADGHEDFGHRCYLVLCRSALSVTENAPLGLRQHVIQVQT